MGAESLLPRGLASPSRPRFSLPARGVMSRPRGVRTGAEMPASKMLFLKVLIRFSTEHS
jgi:hypothetical protein